MPERPCSVFLTVAGNPRMGERRRMRLSPEGAHNVAVARAAALDGHLKIEEFIEGEPHEPSYIRPRPRTVCVDFYRKGDPGLFGEAATLDQIIRAPNDGHNDYAFKGALGDLKNNNDYSRGENHAEIKCDP